MTEDVSVDLTDPGAFDRWERVTIRYSDEDRMGHVNNNAYNAWIEVARASLNSHYLSFGPDWLSTVLASFKIDYLRETRFPGEVRIGVRLLRLGNRSYVTGYGVFREDVCLATAQSTNVFFDLRSRVSVEPSEDVRRVMRRDLAMPLENR